MTRWQCDFNAHVPSVMVGMQKRQQLLFSQEKTGEMDT
jgi:hypothetical protein